VVSLALHWLVDVGNISQIGHELVEFLHAILLIRELTTAHNDGDFHHVALGQEFATALGLTVEVTDISAEAKTDCFK
jgi:hypothetical protein